MASKVEPISKHERYLRGWVCGCGGDVFHLLADGRVLCPGCECINTKLRVEEVEDGNKEAEPS